MYCCLWLNGVKVKTAAEIKQNYDLASLRGYFLGGSLIKWLICNGGREYAERLNDISVCDDINDGINFAFGMTGENESVSVVQDNSCGLLPVNKGSISSFSLNPSIPLNSSFFQNSPHLRGLSSFRGSSFLRGSSSFRSSSFSRSLLSSFKSSSFHKNSSFLSGSYYKFGSSSFRRSGSAGSFQGSLKSRSLHVLNNYGYGIHLISEAKFGRRKNKC